jgi:hypothetical protein
MGLRRRYGIAAAIVWLAALAVFVMLGGERSPRGTIVGTVTDALSGDAVYGARIVVGGRSTMHHLDRDFRITRLTPGRHTVWVTAPGYEPVAREILVKNGVNSLHISMPGAFIPDLDHILVFTDPIKGVDIGVEIRYVNKAGTGIKHYPRVPISMEAKLYARVGSETDFRRGRLTYSGPVELYWESGSSLAKNRGIISKDKLMVNPTADERYAVLDTTVHLSQGSYQDSRTDVLLEW